MDLAVHAPAVAAHALKQTVASAVQGAVHAAGVGAEDEEPEQPEEPEAHQRWLQLAVSAQVFNEVSQ